MKAEPSPMRTLMERVSVIPILTIHEAGIAGDLAKAMLDGGLDVFEVVVRTPDSLRAIEIMRRQAPDAHVGAGTIVTPEDLARAVDAGAEFGVSPGLTDALAEAVRRHGLPFLPGATDPSAIQRALEHGFRELKFFPAFGGAGVAWLKMLAPVYPAVTFCPTGGIGRDDVAAYINLPNCRTIGCSWVAPAPLVAARDWPAITELARVASSFRRSAHV
jgi:2-dehydro-3-deoxyphosphogluconate aldolase/(4S)-4-hydroxy-2-oxoglutarate aldolase